MRNNIMSNYIHTINASDFSEKKQQKQSFILNVIATWCSDCTAQALSLQTFTKTMKESGLEVFNLIAQNEKSVFIDCYHEKLINELGGHGYPRTILIKEGKIISADNVEVITEQALTTLAIEFKNLL